MQAGERVRTKPSSHAEKSAESESEKSELGAYNAVLPGMPVSVAFKPRGPSGERMSAEMQRYKIEKEHEQEREEFEEVKKYASSMNNLNQSEGTKSDGEMEKKLVEFQEHREFMKQEEERIKKVTEGLTRGRSRMNSSVGDLVPSAKSMNIPLGTNKRDYSYIKDPPKQEGEWAPPSRPVHKPRSLSPGAHAKTGVMVGPHRDRNEDVNEEKNEEKKIAAFLFEEKAALNARNRYSDTESVESTSQNLKDASSVEREGAEAHESQPRSPRKVEAAEKDVSTELSPLPQDTSIEGSTDDASHNGGIYSQPSMVVEDREVHKNRTSVQASSASKSMTKGARRAPSIVGKTRNPRDASSFGSLQVKSSAFFQPLGIVGNIEEEVSTDLRGSPSPALVPPEEAAASVEPSAQQAGHAADARNADAHADSNQTSALAPALCEHDHVETSDRSTDQAATRRAQSAGTRKRLLDARSLDRRVNTAPADIKTLAESRMMKKELEVVNSSTDLLRGEPAGTNGKQPEPKMPQNIDSGSTPKSIVAANKISQVQFKRPLGSENAKLSSGFRSDVGAPIDIQKNMAENRSAGTVSHLPAERVQMMNPESPTIIPKKIAIDDSCILTPPSAFKSTSPAAGRQNLSPSLTSVAHELRTGLDLFRDINNTVENIRAKSSPIGSPKVARDSCSPITAVRVGSPTERGSPLTISRIGDGMGPLGGESMINDSILSGSPNKCHVALPITTSLDIDTAQSSIDHVQLQNSIADEASQSPLDGESSLDDLRAKRSQRADAKAAHMLATAPQMSDKEVAEAKREAEKRMNSKEPATCMGPVILLSESEGTRPLLEFSNDHISSFVLSSTSHGVNNFQDFKLGDSKSLEHSVLEILGADKTEYSAAPVPGHFQKLGHNLENNSATERRATNDQQMYSVSRVRATTHAARAKTKVRGIETFASEYVSTEEKRNLAKFALEAHAKHIAINKKKHSHSAATQIESSRQEILESNVHSDATDCDVVDDQVQDCLNLLQKQKRKFQKLSDKEEVQKIQERIIRKGMKLLQVEDAHEKHQLKLAIVNSQRVLEYLAKTSEPAEIDAPGESKGEEQNAAGINGTRNIVKSKASTLAQLTSTVETIQLAKEASILSKKDLSAYNNSSAFARDYEDTSENPIRRSGDITPTLVHLKYKMSLERAENAQKAAVDGGAPYPPEEDSWEILEKASEIAKIDQTSEIVLSSAQAKSQSVNMKNHVVESPSMESKGISGLNESSKLSVASSAGMQVRPTLLEPSPLFKSAAYHNLGVDDGLPDEVSTSRQSSTSNMGIDSADNGMKSRESNGIIASSFEAQALQQHENTDDSKMEKHKSYQSPLMNIMHTKVDPSANDLSENGITEQIGTESNLVLGLAESTVAMKGEFSDLLDPGHIHRVAFEASGALAVGATALETSLGGRGTEILREDLGSLEDAGIVEASGLGTKNREERTNLAYLDRMGSISSNDGASTALESDFSNSIFSYSRNQTATIHAPALSGNALRVGHGIRRYDASSNEMPGKLLTVNQPSAKPTTASRRTSRSLHAEIADIDNSLNRPSITRKLKINGVSSSNRGGLSDRKSAYTNGTFSSTGPIITEPPTQYTNIRRKPNSASIRDLRGESRNREKDRAFSKTTTASKLRPQSAGPSARSGIHKKESRRGDSVGLRVVNWKYGSAPVQDVHQDEKVDDELMRGLVSGNKLEDPSLTTIDRNFDYIKFDTQPMSSAGDYGRRSKRSNSHKGHIPLIGSQNESKWIHLDPNSRIDSCLLRNSVNDRITSGAPSREIPSTSQHSLEAESVVAPKLVPAIQPSAPQTRFLYPKSFLAKELSKTDRRQEHIVRLALDSPTSQRTDEDSAAKSMSIPKIQIGEGSAHLLGM